MTLFQDICCKSLREHFEAVIQAAKANDESTTQRFFASLGFGRNTDRSNEKQRHELEFIDKLQQLKQQKKTDEAFKTEVNRLIEALDANLKQACGPKTGSKPKTGQSDTAINNAKVIVNDCFNLCTINKAVDFSIEEQATPLQKYIAIAAEYLRPFKDGVLQVTPELAKKKNDFMRRNFSFAMKFYHYINGEEPEDGIDQLKKEFIALMLESTTNANRVACNEHPIATPSLSLLFFTGIALYRASSTGELGEVLNRAKTDIAVSHETDESKDSSYFLLTQHLLIKLYEKAIEHAKSSDASIFNWLLNTRVAERVGLSGRNEELSKKKQVAIQQAIDKIKGLTPKQDDEKNQQAFNQCAEELRSELAELSTEYDENIGQTDATTSIALETIGTAERICNKLNVFNKKFDKQDPYEIFLHYIARYLIQKDLQSYCRKNQGNVVFRTAQKVTVNPTLLEQKKDAVKKCVKRTKHVIDLMDKTDDASKIELERQITKILIANSEMANREACIEESISLGFILSFLTMPIMTGKLVPHDGRLGELLENLKKEMGSKRKVGEEEDIVKMTSTDKVVEDEECQTDSAVSQSATSDATSTTTLPGPSSTPADSICSATHLAQLSPSASSKSARHGTTSLDGLNIDGAFADFSSDLTGDGSETVVAAKMQAAMNTNVGGSTPPPHLPSSAKAVANLSPIVATPLSPSPASTQQEPITATTLQ